MYVFFDKRRVKKSRLIHYVLPRRWNHVFTVEDYNGRLLVFDPTLDGIKLFLRDQTIETLLSEALAAQVTAILHYVPPEPALKYIPRGIYTCVGAVKAALNLDFKAFFILTPRGLFRYLVTKPECLVIYKGA